MSEIYLPSSKLNYGWGLQTRADLRTSDEQENRKEGFERPFTRRLNALLSRQRQALVIIGDKDYTNILRTDPIDVRIFNSRNYPVVQVFQRWEASW